MLPLVANFINEERLLASNKEIRDRAADSVVDSDIGTSADCGRRDIAERPLFT